MAPARGNGVSAVLLSARMVARTSARRELLQALLEWAAAARRQTDLRAANVYEDAEAPATFGLSVECEGETALEAHVRSDSFGVLLGALQLLAQSARLTVTGASGDEGTDALPRIRRLREAGDAGVSQ